MITDFSVYMIPVNEEMVIIEVVKKDLFFWDPSFVLKIAKLD